MERNYNNNKFRSVIAIFGSFLIQLTFGSAYTAGKTRAAAAGPPTVEAVTEANLVAATVFVIKTLELHIPEWILNPRLELPLLQRSNSNQSIKVPYLNRVTSVTGMSKGEMYDLKRENVRKLIPSNLKTAKVIFGLAMFGLSASMSFGGFIEKKLKRSKTIFLGCVIMSYGVFLSGIIQQSGKNTDYLTVTYGLFCGLGAGLTYAITLGVPTQWSERSKGLIIGIILSGFALGPLFYQAFSKIQQSISSNIDVASHQLFFEFDFWIIWLNLALNSVGMILFLQLYPIIFLFNTEFKNDSTIYVVSLTNAFGRIYWGYISDKIPKQFVLILLNFGSVFMYVFLLLMFKTGKGQLFDDATFNFIFGIYCAWVSGNFSLTPALMADRFGEKYFPTNYGYVFTSYTVAGIITSALADKMACEIDLTLRILISIALLSLLLSILLKLYPRRSITWRDIEKLFCC